MSKMRCLRSSGSTNNLMDGVSVRPQSKERAPRTVERVSEQSMDSLAETGVGSISRGMDLTLPALTFYVFWLRRRRGPVMAKARERLQVRDERRDPGKSRKGAGRSEENQYVPAGQRRSHGPRANQPPL